MFGTVTDLDRATIVHLPGGGKRVMLPGQDVSEEEKRQQHRAAHEAYQAEQQAAEARDGRIAERVQTFIEAGPGDRDGYAPGLTLARAGLVRHLDWVRRTRQQAAAADARMAAIADAAGRHEAAAAALDDLEIDVMHALGEWIRFGSEGVAPDARVAEREYLRSELIETETLARLAEDAQFEAAVAQAAVAKLASMLPALRADVLVEEVAAPIAERIQTLTGDLAKAYSLLAALGVATDRRSLPREAKIELPKLPTGTCGIEITAEPDDVAGWHQALADLEADPLAQIRLLQSKCLPEQPALKSPSLIAVCRRALGGPK